MSRIHQYLLIASFLPFCWLAMMVVHELGHVIVGHCTGGVVTKVVLHPLAISRTDVKPNPMPLIVAWAGPIIGIMLPLLIWGILFLVRIPTYLPRFFAGFCLVANGAYLGIGSFGKIGDAGVIISLGSPMWPLWLFGFITLPSGFLLWHRLGSHFGLGNSHGHVNAKAAYCSLSLLFITMMVTLIL